MARPAAVDVPAFAAAQIDLLAAELQSEVTETSEAVGGHTPSALQRAGLALTNLTVDGQRTGMGGRTVLTLGPDAAVTAASTSKDAKDGPELPEHRVRTGDIVLVAEQPGGSAKKQEMRELEKKGVRGVVTRVRRTQLEVAVDEDDPGNKGGASVDALGGSRVWILKLADDVTYKRMTLTMRKLQDMPASSYTPLMQVLFGLSSPSSTSSADASIDWIDPTLNDSQKDAVRFALASSDVALIHGPPGTGKTHTLVELILQLALRRGQRVLVCGPSNISVDNLVERLAPHSVPMVRLGHPARLLPSVLGHSLDVLTQTSEAGAIVRDVRADLDAKQRELRPAKKPPKGVKINRKAIYADLKDLRKEYRARERRCVRDLVASSRVVLATLHGAGGSQLRTVPGDELATQFDVVVIDEASQALEAQCWVPLVTARKAVLAGDHLQLPPTVKTKKPKKAAAGKTGAPSKGKAGKAGKKDAEAKTEETAEAKSASSSHKVSLEYTLFDRLLALHGNAIKRMLTTQYRMHEAIMRFPSDTLYDGKLVAAEAVQARLLKDIQYSRPGDGDAPGASSARVRDTDETREPLVFIDTQGGDFPEGEDSGDASSSHGGGATSKSQLLGDSKCNPMEALLVRRHVRTLIAAGLRPDDIAVVTPYNAQLAQLAPLKVEFPAVELGSVDGFQGREKEAVIVSLVRSNTASDVGFLAEKRRLNVAMTRPKRSLTVIGDSETVKRGSHFLKQWMDFLEENADLRYPDVSEVMAEA